MKIKPYIITVGAWSLLALPAMADTVIQNPLPSSDPEVIISNIISVALGVVGAIALLFFVWGGIQMLISGGVPDRVKKGQNTLMWATLGLIVIFGSYGIVRAIFQAMSGQSII